MTICPDSGLRDRALDPRASGVARRAAVHNVEIVLFVCVFMEIC